MSWIPVEFSWVRFSEVEGTHYFFDPNFPSAVQFLLNGNWESWDVGWVRYKARDPEIRRVAEEAEASLIRNDSSGYRHWPYPPTEEPVLSAQNWHGASPNVDSGAAPLFNPSDGGSPALTGQTLSHLYPQSPQSVSSQSHGQGHNSHAIPYASPYGQVPPISNTSHLTNSNWVPPPQGASPAPEIGDRISAPTPLTQPEPLPSFDPYLEAPASPKSPLPLPATRDTKVLLSLDGDGVRGLSTILLVESLVNAICSKMGRRADPFQIFDLICGTSTGGILAIMLGRLRMRAHKAREAYMQISRAMFNDKRTFFVSLDPHAPPPTNGTQSLESSIEEVITNESGNIDDVFFDARPDSANVFVISTQVDIGVNRPALIRTYPTRRMAGPELDQNLTTFQAMRATSIAPRYMEPQSSQTRRAVIGPGLVDYGTGKNNPIRDLVFECRKLYGYAHDTMVIVSIGSGLGLDRNQEINEMANSVEERANDANVAGDKFEKDNEGLMARGWMKYFRFNVPGLEDVSLDEWSHIEKIKEKTHAYLGSPDVGRRFYACVDVITAIVLGEKSTFTG